MEKIFNDSAARADFYAWSNDQFNHKCKEMQEALLAGDASKATIAAAELSVYQAITQRFTVELNEKLETNERNFN